MASPALSRRMLLAAGAVAVPLVVPRATWSQSDYPNGPVRLVVGFPPGGPTDILARLIAQRMGELIGQQVIVDNKSGAAGNIANEIVAKARPDGYTLLFGTSIMAIAPWLYTNLPYDPLTSLDAVALCSLVPIILVVPAAGAQTTEALVGMLRTEPGKHSYASPGNGSLLHLTGHLFAQRTGGEAIHVPYRGNAPAMQDTIAGRHAYLFDTYGSSKGFIEGGRIRVLGVATEKREPALANFPTIEERAGFPLVSRTWNVVFAPAGTPKPIIERLNGVINRTVADPDVAARAAALAIGLVPDSTPQSADRYYREQLAYWDPIAKGSGAKVE